MSSSASRRGLSRRPPDAIIVAVLGLAGLSASFVQVLIIPIQPTLPALLDARPEDTAWVLTTTLLTGAITTPIAGRLGDLYGKRRVLLVLLGSLVVGSVVAALAPSLPVLLIGRVLQGFSGGTVSLALSLLRDTVHPVRLPGSIAFVSATLGVGGAVGLPIGAIVIEFLDWHALFWLSAGLGASVFVAVLLVVPASTLVAEGRIDVIGAIGLAAAIGGVMLAISRGGEWGWGSAATIGTGLGGLAVLGVWGVFELRHESPIVDLRVAARRPVLLANVASIAVGFALFTSSIAVPQLLTLPEETGVGLGQPLVVSSLVLIPGAIGMMAVSPVAARISARFGARTLLIVGALVIAVGYVLGLFLLSEVWHLLLSSLLNGIGVGLSFAALPLLIMGAVPPTETAAANGLNTLMRSLGTTLASSVIGVILASTVTVSAGVATPTLDAFRFANAAGAAAAVLAAILAVCIPRRRAEPDSRAALPAE